MGKIKLNNWIMLVAFISAAFYFSDFLDVFLKKKNTVEQNLAIVAKELNENTPIMVSDQLILTSVKSQGKTIYYKYFIPGVDAKEIDGDDLKEQLYVLQKNGICNEKNKKVLDEGANFKFTYFDIKDIEITSLLINNNNCLTLKK